MKIVRSNFFTLVLLMIVFFSCNKKAEQNSEENKTGVFVWKSELKSSDIPDSPVKGSINGKEIKIDYINFEQWRGSGDNVINFGDIKPKNNCGYVENGNSFHLLHKSGEIKVGELLKGSFEQNLDGYVAYCDSASGSSSNEKSATDWNCVLVITTMDEKSVKGKIAMCFKDDKRSWIAGTFEATRCFN